jgi:RNA polymerase sigma-70 factor (ECF subfamily)
MNKRSETLPSQNWCPRPGRESFQHARHGLALQVTARNKRATFPAPQNPLQTDTQPRITETLEMSSEYFYEQVRACENALFRTALAMTRNISDAEEITQEALLKAFRAKHTFRGESKFKTWVTQIVINESRQLLRKSCRHVSRAIEAEQIENCQATSLMNFITPCETPLETVERLELRSQLHKALRTLPHDYQTVLLLRDLQGLTTLETATRLGLSVCAVKIRLFRARRKMRGAMTGRYHHAGA